MLDRTTKTGHEKPSPQKLKTKGTIHLLTFLAAFCLLESVGAADTAAGTTPKITLGKILVVLIPLDGKEPFHSAAEVSTALYGYEEGKPERRRCPASVALRLETCLRCTASRHS